MSQTKVRSMTIGQFDQSSDDQSREDSLNMHQRKRKVCFINDSGRQRLKISNLQHTSKKLRRSRNFPSKWIAWRFLKILIFIICLAFFFVQSTRFLTRYYEYPTTTRFTVKKPKMFKMPCITICNTNPIKRSKFCSEYPHLCEPPSNLTEFCSKQPHMCSRNISDLVIPKLDYYASDETDEISTILQNLYENGNMSQEAWSKWTWDIPTGSSKSKSNATSEILNTLENLYESRNLSQESWSNWTLDIPTNLVKIEREMTASLVPGMAWRRIPTCYSANLRFSNNLPASLWSVHEGNFVEEEFVLNMEEDESFYPWETPKFKFAIHSPFVPIHPLAEGEALKIGHFYGIGVKLEEEHLLPYPYQTDCTDYHELWRVNNKTGPRSEEICWLWCTWNHEGDCRNFHCGAKMIQFSVNKWEWNSQNHNQVHECLKNCKEDCEKFKYSYKVFEFPMDEHKFKDQKSHSISVFFFIDDPRVVVKSHIPLYYAGDLFSHIGGLMGCWLGISVATLAGILESTFTEVKHLTWKLGRYVK